MDREVVEFLKSGGVKSEHPRSIAASFARGMTHRICERLRELKAQRTANVKAKAHNLVVPKREIIDAEFAKLYGAVPWKKAKRSKPARSAGAYAAGLIVGDRVALGSEPQINRATQVSGTERHAATSSTAAARGAAPTSAAAARPSWILTLGKHLAALVAASLAFLRSFALIAIVFSTMESIQGLPNGVMRAILWLDAYGALAPLIIAVLVLLPSVHLYRIHWPIQRR